MEKVSTIGLDLAKHVFQAHGASASGAVVFRKKLRREQVLSFFAGQPRCRVAMEACASAHHWARAIGELGHEVRLIPPAYVKPFVKRQKNDMADAEAICAAAQRPTMRFVAVKSEAKQASAVIFRTRDLLVRQRTQIINALRGHLAEFGFIAPQGASHIVRLMAQVEDPGFSIPEAARSCLMRLVTMLRGIQEEVEALDREIAARAKSDHVARRLMTVPGIGPLIATAIEALAPPPETFRSGRDFAAWVGLTPVQKSTAASSGSAAHPAWASERSGACSSSQPAAVVRWAKRKGVPAGSWLARMLARKPPMLVIVALANKNARVAWALLAKGRDLSSSGRGCLKRLGP
jgi:transposase